MEVLVSVLGKLLEEKCEQSVDILASSDSVANRAAAVGVTCVYGLVEEDDGSIRGPRIRVVDNIQLVINRCRTKFQEKTCQ